MTPWSRCSARARPPSRVWEALDQEGLVERLLPDWDRVRNRPQRNPLHTYTVDRHLVETAAGAAALTRDVARPDLLLLSALLHDIGKGWPGDHRVTGEVVARDVARRLGLGPSDAELVAGAVRHHLLLPQTATRRDLDDPVTVAQVAAAVGGRSLLELLHALAIADGQATGPAAWNDWKAGLVGDLVRRRADAAGRGGAAAAAAASPGPGGARRRGGSPRRAAGGLRGDHRRPGPARAAVAGRRACSPRTGSRCAPRTPRSHGTMAVAAFTVAPEFGDPPDADLVTSDLRRALEGPARRGRTAGAADARLPGAAGAVPVAPPKVTLRGRRLADRHRGGGARPRRSRGCSGGSAARSATAAWT